MVTDVAGVEKLYEKKIKLNERNVVIDSFKQLVGNAESSLKTIACGVPQGSTLGPLLFLLYINDLPNTSSKFVFRNFADDTNIFYSSYDSDELQRVINEELGNVLKYCAANMLSYNFKKTNYMITALPKKKTNISITTCRIKQKSQIKYLGVLIDEHLKWDAQLQHINNELTKNIGILFKLRYYMPINSLKKLHYTLIFPYLNYGPSMPSQIKVHLTPKIFFR